MHTFDEPDDPASTSTVVSTLLAEREAFLGFLTKRLGDVMLAEDVLQEAFARGLDRLDTLRDEESAVAWFYRLLRNAVIDHRRRAASAGRALDALAAELDAPAEAPAPVQEAVCRCVGRLATTLKPDYADVIRRVEVDGVSVKDFAAEAGITPNNAAVRVFRAREALRARVRECCGACADAGCRDCTCPTHGEPLMGPNL